MAENYAYTEYNGWKNRATWLVALWLESDEASYHDFQTVPRNKDAIKAYVLNRKMRTCDGFRTDIKPYYTRDKELSMVDWDRITEAYQED